MINTQPIQNYRGAVGDEITRDEQWECKEPVREPRPCRQVTWFTGPLTNSNGHVRTFARLGATRSFSSSWACRAVGRTGRAPQGATRRAVVGTERAAVEGEKSGPMEGRGRCRAILSRSSVAPLDVLMHVENNLTANLLHSFSFLPRALRLASVAHLPDPSFCALSDERTGPSPRPPCRSSSPIFLSLLRGPPARASAGPLAPNRIRNLNF